MHASFCVNQSVPTDRLAMLNIYYIGIIEVFWIVIDSKMQWKSCISLACLPPFARTSKHSHRQTSIVWHSLHCRMEVFWIVLYCKTWRKSCLLASFCANQTVPTDREALLDIHYIGGTEVFWIGVRGKTWKEIYHACLLLRESKHSHRQTSIFGHLVHWRNWRILNCYSW
jgi:hypothetical protein